MYISDNFNFKDTKLTKERVTHCFINNKYIYIKTNQERYLDLKTSQIDNSPYNGFGDKLHLPHNAEVFLGTPRYANIGLVVNF